MQEPKVQCRTEDGINQNCFVLVDVPIAEITGVFMRMGNMKGNLEKLEGRS